MSRASCSRSYAGRQAAATASPVGVQVDVAGSVRLEAGRRPHGVVPVRGPHAVAVARPGGPRQHPVGEPDPEPVAEPSQVGLGIAQEVSGVDDRRSLAGCRQRVEEAHLLEDADVLGLAGLARAEVGRDHLVGVRISSTLRNAAESSDRSSSANRWWVMCLTYWTVHAVRQRREQTGDDGGRVGGLGGEHVLAAGWSPRARRAGQVVRRRTARRRPPCRAGSPRRASSPWRCCAAPTTWRADVMAGHDAGPYVGRDQVGVQRPAAARPSARGARADGATVDRA